MSSAWIFLQSGGGQKKRLAFGDDNGVFVVRGKASIGRADCPAVAIERDAAGGRDDDWFDGDDETFGENVPRYRIGIFGDVVFFVDRAPDAVAAELRNDAEAATANLAVHGPSDILRAIAQARGLQSVTKGFFGATRKFETFRRLRWDFDGDCGVGVVAVLFGGQVELYEVTGTDFAVAWDSVNNLVVHADANITGKTINHRRR